MAIPIPGPPCTLPDAPSGWTGPGEAWFDAALAEGSIIHTPNAGGYPGGAIFDQLRGGLVDPIALGGGLTPVYYWLIGDPCYGMTYRNVIDSTDPTTISRLKDELELGSCCYTQVYLRGDFHVDDPFFPAGALPYGFGACYDYNTHSEHLCQRQYGLQCCSRAHVAGYDPDTGLFPADWDVEERAGPSRWTCENWTVDGTWVSGVTCEATMEVHGNVQCATLCDFTPYACCGCGGLCVDSSMADCVNLHGDFHRFGHCAESGEPCEDKDRDCALNLWRMVLRPDHHYPTRSDYNGKRPLMQPGDHAPRAQSNPSQRYGDQLGPWCDHHYGAIRVDASGDFAVAICGNHQEYEGEGFHIDGVISHPDENMEASRGVAQTLVEDPDNPYASHAGDVVWPIAYRPSCGTPSFWGWEF